jgi:hypothetical protein
MRLPLVTLSASGGLYGERLTVVQNGGGDAVDGRDCPPGCKRAIGGKEVRRSEDLTAELLRIASVTYTQVTPAGLLTIEPLPLPAAVTVRETTSAARLSNRRGATTSSQPCRKRNAPNKASKGREGVQEAAHGCSDAKDRRTDPVRAADMQRCKSMVRLEVSPESRPQDYAEVTAWGPPSGHDSGRSPAGAIVGHHKPSPGRGRGLAAQAGSR